MNWCVNIMLQRKTFKVIYKAQASARDITLKHKAHEVRFSTWRCFTHTAEGDKINCFKRLGEYLCSLHTPIALYGINAFSERLLHYTPQLLHVVRFFVDNDEAGTRTQVSFAPVFPISSLPRGVNTVFLCELTAAGRARMRRKLPPGLHVFCPDVLTEIDWKTIPETAWIPAWEIIYPLEIPEIQVPPELDLLLVDAPAKNMGLAPNGLAYVHNALLQEGFNFRTLDVDVIAYHRFHMHRLLDGPDEMEAPDGTLLPDDPWAIEHTRLWTSAAAVAYFRPVLDEAVSAITAARPRILGLSIHECNLLSATYIAQRVKATLPDTIILVGGYSCLDHRIGLRAFPLADYMVVGEADLAVGPLVRRLIAGERPKDVPGIVSKYDSQGRVFQPGLLPVDLDALQYPDYGWSSLDVYRNYDGYQLTPIVGSRGCRWSRCTFCTERFYWRTRSARNIADEIEWLCEQGIDNIMFNDSDLNGEPSVVEALCDEIAARRLPVRLSGQLRIDHRNTRRLFEKMRKAGFGSLRFGVDAWSANGLKIQKKGYSVALVAQNLRRCHEAGIFTEVNIVVGVPGEGDADVAECVRNIVELKQYIGRFTVINPLMLKAGSEFWEHSDRYGICFKGDKYELRLKYPTGIPSSLWFSVNPFIDETVRTERVELITEALRSNGIQIGSVAATRIDEMRAGADDMRGLSRFRSGENSTRKGMLRERSVQEPSRSTGRLLLRYKDRFFEAPGAVLEEIECVSRQPFASSPSDLRLEPSTSKAAFKELSLSVSEASGGKNTEDPVGEIIRMGGFDLVREIPESILQLLQEGFHGYNVVKAGMEYFALRQGVPFDSDRIVGKGYEHGICFYGKSAMEVRRRVAAYVTAPQ